MKHDFGVSCLPEGEMDGDERGRRRSLWRRGIEERRPRTALPAASPQVYFRCNQGRYRWYVACPSAWMDMEDEVELGWSVAVPAAHATYAPPFRLNLKDAEECQSDDDSSEDEDNTVTGEADVLLDGCSCCSELQECCGIGGRPQMAPCQKGAKVYSSGSTACSRALASQVEMAALSTRCVHGRSSTGTPWIYARRLQAIEAQNRVFLSWCRTWIEELYGVDASLLRLDRTEPHLVKYDHSLHAKAFKGIGTHQDDSFVTCIMGLSPANAYVGGGTYFASGDYTVRLGPGEVLLFQGHEGPYSAPHRAQPISEGKRVLYLAFFKLRKTRKGKKKRATSRCSTPRVGTSRGTSRLGTPAPRFGYGSGPAAAARPSTAVGNPYGLR